MKLTVKDLKHNSHEFNDVNIEQTVGEFAEEVKKIFKFTDNVRLIYCGRILEHNKCLNEYFKEVNCGFIVCMAIKPQLIHTPPVSQSPVSQSPVSQSSVSQSSVSQSSVSQSSVSQQPISNINPLTNLPRMSQSNISQTYTIDQIRAFLIVFTRFIKMSPEVYHMFSTNDAAFQSFLMSQTFMNEMLNPILQSSSEIVSALQIGNDIAITVPIFSNQFNDSTSPQTPPPTPSQTPQPTNNLFSTNSNETSTTLSAEDSRNIIELCELGFTEIQVMQIYMMTNKNKELTASLLYEYN